MAYCCCENTTVEEKIYPAKQNPYDIIDLISWMESDMLKKITPKLIHPLPNTYIYSKRLTESLLQDYVSRVPIIVARPSIVLPSFKEPFAGWTDSLDGPVGFFVAEARGIMRTSRLDMETKTDMIPVDMAINSIIILPWANPKEQLLKQIKVYNICQNSEETLTWGDVTEYLMRMLSKYPLDVMYWYPNFNPTTKSLFIYKVKLVILHYLPAYIIDFILQLIGQKPFLVNVYDRLRHGEKMISYFTQQPRSFVHDNVLQLEKQLNDTDKQLYTVNMNEIDSFEDYFDNIMATSKVHVFKEDMNKLGRAKKFTKIMYILDQIVLVLRYCIILRFLIFVFSMVLSIFD